MALTEAQDEGSTAVYQQELANIAHEHYQTLRKDYDFSRIHVQCAVKLADFFGSYARKKMGSAQRVSWDIAAVLHAVILVTSNRSLMKHLMRSILKMQVVD